MTLQVFPTLPGVDVNVTRTPLFDSITLRAVSGREVRGTYQNYPLYRFELAYEFLRDFTPSTSDHDTLVGFFLNQAGQFNHFLFTDWSDNTVTAMPFGTGDGSTTIFQLTRAFGAGGFTFAEPVANLNGNPSIYINGTLKTLGTDYTVSSSGGITFAVAPAASAALTWSGSFYYLCRFLVDEIDMNYMFQGLWSGKKINFVGAPGNRV